MLAGAEAVARIEAEMRAVVAEERACVAALGTEAAGGAAAVDALYGMMAYHLGWADADFRPAASDGGKKLRGQFCLLACALLGGYPATALPLAASVELLHTFTLVHDDIQDRSPTRHHRPTVWSLWGEAQAINVGDGLYALARLALLRLGGGGVAPGLTLELAALSERTLLRIMEGQYLDLRFEGDWAADVPLYLRMIEGKTASLIAYALEAGGRLGGATPAQAAALARCGRALGLGFQVRDDILDIWGTPELTGKPAASDVTARKKSLPVLLAMEAATPAERATLRAVYAEPEVGPDGVAAVLAILARTEAQARSQEWVERAHAEALAALAEVGRDGEAAAAIRALLARLAERAF